MPVKMPVNAIRLGLSPLLSAAQARARDRHTIDVIGVPGLVLMEHAGRAVADVAMSARADDAGHGGDVGPVVVVCGGGNNGGDGYVCARHLLARGVDVVVLAAADPARLTGDAKIAADLFKSAAAHIGHPGIAVGDTAARVAASIPTVIVDALFGTGLSRPLDEDAIAIVVAIETVRARGARVIAVDVPSGLPTDGQAHTVAVAADITVTFGGEKIVHRSEPGRAHCGRVISVDIGFFPPPDEVTTVWHLDTVQLPALDVTAHKGRFGHVGVVAGDPGTGGAAILSALGALRSGAGLVTLLGDVDVPRPIEVMATPFTAVGPRTVASLDERSSSPPRPPWSLDAMVVGPGLTGDVATMAHVATGVRSWRTMATDAEQMLWTVADAGAVSGLSRGDADVWTPHPGEAARVLGISVVEVQHDRLATARRLVDVLGGVVVLKGHAPVIATASRLVVVGGDAPALAVAGSGDVLAGVIAAGLGGAFGASAVDAVVIASVWLHQRAGQGQGRGLLASELAERVRGAVAEARGDTP
jgi:NAD(P)H-hydrate epimerase